MAEQREAELISWLACERKASVKVWDHFPDLPEGGAALSMLQVSSRYNLLVAATPTGLYVSPVSEMLSEVYRLHELDLEGQELPMEAAARQLNFVSTARLERELESSGAAAQVVALSRSEEWMALASGHSLLLYSCSDLQRRTSTAKPRVRARFEEEIVACEWAPEGDDRLMLATRSGIHVVAWDEEMQAAALPPRQFAVKGTVTCAAWLSASLVLSGLNDNKAYVTDVQTGQGWGFKLAPKDAFEDEEEGDAGAVRSVISLGGGAVIIGFSEGERMSLSLQLSADMRSVTEWTNLSTAFFQDPDLPWGPGWAMGKIAQQQLAIISCQSADATVFAQHKSGKWVPLEFDDTSVLPMPAFIREDVVGDEEDVAAAGLVGVAYCNTAVPGDQGCGLPHLFLLSTEGILEVWSMKNEEQDPELTFGSALPVITVQDSVAVSVGAARGTPTSSASGAAQPAPASEVSTSFGSVPSFGTGSSSFGEGGVTPGASPFSALSGGTTDDGKSPFDFAKPAGAPSAATTPNPATAPFGASPFAAVGSTREEAKSTFDFGKPPGSKPAASKDTALTTPAGATREAAKKAFDFGKPPGAAKPAGASAGTGANAGAGAAPTIATAGATREAAKSAFDFGKPPGAGTPAVSPFGVQGSTREAAKSAFDFGKPPGATPPSSTPAGGTEKPGTTRAAAKSAFDFGKPPGAGSPTASPFGEAGSTRAAAKSAFDFGKPPGASNTPVAATTPVAAAGSTRAAAKSSFDFGKPPGASKPATALVASTLAQPGSTREAAKSAFDFGKPPGASKAAPPTAAPAVGEPGSTRAAAKSTFDFGKPPGAKSLTAAPPAAAAAAPAFSAPGSTREAAKSSFDFGKPPGTKAATPAAAPAFSTPGSTREAAKSSFDFGKPPGAKASVPKAAPAAQRSSTAAARAQDAPPKAEGRDALQFTFGAELSDNDADYSDEERAVTPQRRGPAVQVYEDPIQQWAEDMFTSEVAAFEEELERVDELSVAMDDRTAVLMEGRSMERIRAALEQVGALYAEMQATRGAMEQLHSTTRSLAERFVEGPFAVFKHAEALLASMDHIMASPPPSLDPATAAARSLLARKTTALLKRLEEVRGLLGHMRRRQGKGLGELATGRPRSAEELYTAMYHLHGSMASLATQVEELGARLRRWRRSTDKRARALDCCSAPFSPSSPTAASLRSPASRASRSRLAAIERALGEHLSFSPGTPRVVARTPVLRPGRGGGEQKKEGRDPLDVGGLVQGTPEVFAPATLATMSKSPATPSARSPAVSPWARGGGGGMQKRPPAPAATPLTAAGQLAKQERPSLERTFSWPKGERSEDSPSFPRPQLPASDGQALFPRRLEQGFLSPADAADKTKSAPQVPTYEQPLKGGDDSPGERQRSGSLKAKDKRRSELFSSSGSVPTMSSFALSSEAAFSFASVNKSTPILSDGGLRQSAFSGWDAAAEGGSFGKEEKEEGEQEEEDDLFFAKRAGNLSSSDSVTLKEAFSSSGRGDLKSSLEGEREEEKGEGRGSTVVEVSSDSEEETEEFTSDEEETKTESFSDSSSDGEVESTVFSVTSEKGQHSAPTFFGSPAKEEGESQAAAKEEEEEESSGSSRFSFGESSFGSGEGLSKSFGVSFSSKGGDPITKSAPATDRTSLVKSSGLLGAGGGSFASVSVSAGGLSDSWVAGADGGDASGSSVSPFGSGSVPTPFSKQEGKPEASALFGGTPTREDAAPASVFGAADTSTSVFASGTASAFGSTPSAAPSSFSAFGSAAPAAAASTPSVFGSSSSGGAAQSSDPFAGFGAPKAATGAFGQTAAASSLFGAGGGGGSSFAAPASGPGASPFTAGSRAPGAASTNSAFGQSSTLSLGPSFGTPNAAAMTSAAAVGASAPLFGGGGGGGGGQASFSSFSAAPATSPNVFGGGSSGGASGGSAFTPPPASGGSLWAPRK